ncbi:hypothetical protein [Bacillus sp. EB600]|uniref:hypothetical protein n=1 Tax=Bacillus sp. EB600 TaxID=2806345 RepID=UPI002109840E|nr:hypothetical protein [Bacillus sp. EB600]MCQ6282826.1 hypothetical protein [Bacillus sp. EB600]
MDKTKELIEKLKENPDRELIFMYPDEGSDYSYTMGYPSQIIVDEYWVDDECVYLREKDGDELFDKLADDMFDELFPNQKYATDEQNKIIDEKTEQKIKELEWKKAIVVYIHY